MCRATRQKGIDVSGVIGVACARHAIFRPGGMVDLYVGERYIISSNSRLLAECFHRYSHVDYAISWALRTVDSSVEVYITYDIACQYGVHFVKRLSDFSDLNPELLKKSSSLYRQCTYLLTKNGVSLIMLFTTQMDWE